MKTSRTAGIVATTLLLIGPDFSAEATPRQDVVDMAKLVEANYFDQVRAAEIGNQLREEAKRGAFDKYRDPHDLAVAVTDELRALDRHFHVSWDPKYPSAGAEASATPADYGQSAARANYGFRKVDRLPGNVGYVELSEVAEIDFDDPTDKARAAADAALLLLRGSDAVLLDLRGNGGGAPAMVGYLVSAFVKADADVYNTFYSRAGTESERPPTPFPNPMLDVPLLILANTQTGSAAEAIAFTLQSCGRARVVGEATGGAANPGESFHTPTGYTIFISTGSPKNPINHRNWESTGVQPDVYASSGEALTRAQVLAVQAALARLPRGPARRDSELTLEALQAIEHPFTVQNPHDYAGKFGVYAVSSDAGVLALRTRGGSATKLISIASDTFAPESELTRRIHFYRDKDETTALEIILSSGEKRRIARNPSS